MVKIRLQRHGRKKAPYYHIVVADSRKKRDGRIIEDLGRYNPVLETAQIKINTERAMYWLKTGAQPTDTVERLLRKEGIYFRLHLERWKKTPEEIEQTVSAWKAERDAAKKTPLSNIEQKKAALKAEEEAFKLESEKAAAAAAKKAEDDKVAKAKAEAEAKAAAEAPAEETITEDSTIEETSVEETSSDVEATTEESTEEETPVEETATDETPVAEVEAETPAEEEKKD